MALSMQLLFLYVLESKVYYITHVFHHHNLPEQSDHGPDQVHLPQRHA